MANKAIDIEILGRSFAVVCSEDERESLLQAVKYIDVKMREIRDAGKTVSVERIAMMAALNIAHELLTIKAGDASMGDLKHRIAGIENQIDAALATK